MPEFPAGSESFESFESFASSASFESSLAATSSRRRSRFVVRALAGLGAALLGLLATWAPAVAAAESAPVTITGKAILEHPAGKAIVEAGRLLKAGKAAESRKLAAKEVREEWAAMSAAEQKAESDRLIGRTPDPATFEADIARVGEMVVDGDFARLSIPTPSGDVSAMGFAALEGGKWRVNRGPMTLQVPEPESAPAIRGAAILDHEAGKLALDYAGKLAAGKLDAALALLSTSARAQRDALPADQRRQSDDFRRQQLPQPKVLADRIRDGGELTFPGEKAFLMMLSVTTTQNADGSVTSTSETTGLGFVRESGHWKIAD